MNNLLIHISMRQNMLTNIYPNQKIWRPKEILPINEMCGILIYRGNFHEFA